MKQIPGIMAVSCGLVRSLFHPSDLYEELSLLDTIEKKLESWKQ